jgi:hypothetical protein
VTALFTEQNKVMTNDYHRKYIRAYRINNPDFYAREKQALNKRNKELKERVFAHYCNGAPGAIACSHCGFSDIRALQLHHINGDGAQDRKRLNLAHTQSTMFYRRVEKEGYPDGLAVLCANCHILSHSK